VPDVRVHDLRRTLGSWLAASGYSLPLIGRALNHTQVSTTTIYARLNLDPVREALEHNAALMLSAGLPQQTSGKVPEGSRRPTTIPAANATLAPSQTLHLGWVELSGRNSMKRSGRSPRSLSLRNLGSAIAGWEKSVRGSKFRFRPAVTGRNSLLANG